MSDGDIKLTGEHHADDAHDASAVSYAEVGEQEETEVETVTIPRDLLTKLRQSERENKRLSRDAKRAADLEARLKEIEDADKSEHEKAKERLTELEGSLTSTTSELREARLALAAHGLAGDLGLADVEVALALLPRGDVEYDDTGTPTNLQQLLEGLVERKPILKGSPTPPRKPSLDGGGGGPKSTPPGLTAQELEWAKKLGYDDPAEYVRDRDNGTMDAWVGAKPAN